MSILAWFTNPVSILNPPKPSVNPPNVTVGSKPGIVRRFTSGVGKLITGAGSVTGSTLAAVLTPLLPIVLILIAVTVFSAMAARKVLN